MAILSSPIHYVPEPKPFEERRFKVFYLDEHLLIHILNAFNGDRRMLSLPVIDGVPADAVITSVFAEPARRAIAVRVAHPSFDVVPDGSYSPADSTSFKMRHIELKDLGDDRYQTSWDEGSSSPAADVAEATKRVMSDEVAFFFGNPSVE